MPLQATPQLLLDNSLESQVTLKDDHALLYAWDCHAFQDMTCTTTLRAEGCE